MSRRVTVCCYALLLAWFPSASAFAGVVSATSGSAQILTPPPGTNLSDDSGFTSPLVRAFDERSAVTVTNLPVNTLVSNLTAGTFTNAKASGAWGTVSGVFNGHLLHFDVSGNPTTGTIDMITSGAFAAADGSVTFDAPIVAIAYLKDELNGSDAAFGLAGLTYPNTTPPAANVNRDLESGDDIWLSADRRTLYYNWRVGGAFDEVRVLTATDPNLASVPEPSGLVLWGLGGAVLFLARAGRPRGRN